MSVDGLSTEPQLRMFGPFDIQTPQPLPIGLWRVRFDVTGDATGGVARAHVDAPAGLAGAYVFNLEAVFPGRATAGDIEYSVDLNPGEDWNPGLGEGFSISWQGQIQSTSSSIIEASLGRDFFDLGRLIPPWQTDEGDTWELDVGWNENTNGALYTARAWGYVWEREVRRKFLGGPRRP